MKLVFFKEDEEIKLRINHQDVDVAFNYIKLIEFLYNGNELEETQYFDEISPEEKIKIDEMIIKINEKVIVN